MKHSALFLVLASLAIGCTEPAPEPEHPVEEPIENPSETPSVSGRVLVGNTIELNSDFSCTYTLKYEHDDALPLSDFESICTLDVEQLTCYEDFIDQNIAPREAETIGIYASEGDRISGFSPAGLKPANFDTPLYTFGLLSDVHIGRSSSSKAESDFENALNFFNSQNVLMTCICGDITQTATEAQFTSYASIRAKSKVPVYATTGNHDCTGDTGVNPEFWTKYTEGDIVFETCPCYCYNIWSLIFSCTTYHNSRKWI